MSTNFARISLEQQLMTYQASGIEYQGKSTRTMSLCSDYNNHQAFRWCMSSTNFASVHWYATQHVDGRYTDPASHSKLDNKPPFLNSHSSSCTLCYIPGNPLPSWYFTSFDGSSESSSLNIASFSNNLLIKSGSPLSTN